MVPLCTSCAIRSSQTKIGEGMSLEECNNQCLTDANCNGVDFGKGSKANICFHNWEDTRIYRSHNKFNAYAKSCGSGILFESFYF